MKRNHKILFLILVISVIIRISYVLVLEGKLYFPDSARYDRIASELLTGNGFSSASTAPLYPIFLSFIYRFFGHSFLMVRIIQSVIGSASILMIYLIARETFSEKAGLIAGSISAVYPFFIFFTGLLLTETLFIFLLLCLIFFLRKMTIRLQWNYAVCTGIFAGLSILIKPVMLYFLLFALIIVMAVYRDRRKKLLINAILVLIITGSILMPWAWSNHKRTGEFIFLTTSGGLTFYESNNPLADGGPGLEKIVRTEEMENMNEIELDKHFKQQAILFIKNNPRRFIELAVIKLRRFWSPVPNAGSYRSMKYKLISIFSFCPVILLAVWGMIAWRKQWKYLLFLYLPVVFFGLLHMVMLGSVRYRIPVMPFMIVLAAGGISNLLWRENEIPELRLE